MTAITLDHLPVEHGRRQGPPQWAEAVFEPLGFDADVARAPLEFMRPAPAPDARLEEHEQSSSRRGECRVPAPSAPLPTWQ